MYTDLCSGTKYTFESPNAHTWCLLQPIHTYSNNKTSVSFRSGRPFHPKPLLQCKDQHVCLYLFPQLTLNPTPVPILADGGTTRWRLHVMFSGYAHYFFMT